MPSRMAAVRFGKHEHMDKEKDRSVLRIKKEDENPLTMVVYVARLIRKRHFEVKCQSVITILTRPYAIAISF